MNRTSLKAAAFLAVMFVGLLPFFTFADNSGQFEVLYTNTAPAPNFKPQLTYTYISIGDTIAFNHGHSYGPYNTYAVSVQISCLPKWS